MGRGLIGLARMSTRVIWPHRGTEWPASFNEDSIEAHVEQDDEGSRIDRDIHDRALGAALLGHGPKNLFGPDGISVSI